MTSDLIRRAQRTVAQRGVRSLLGNVFRRIRTGNFSPAAAEPLVRPGTHPFDDREGTDTAGFIHGSALKTGSSNDLYSVAYYGTAPSLFLGALHCWQAAPPVHSLPETSFIDFGSGKGRVLLLASQQPFRQCIGVEMHPGLHTTATTNIELWKGKGKAVCLVESRNVDATQFVFPDGPCLAYLFNPFTSKILADVLSNITAQFADRPGELDLLYVNSEFNDLFQQTPGFTMIWSQPVYLSEEDAAVDLAQIGTDHLGQPGQQPCTAWRWTGNVA